MDGKPRGLKVLGYFCVEFALDFDKATKSLVVDESHGLHIQH